MVFLKALRVVFLGLAGMTVIVAFVILQHNVWAFSLGTGAQISVFVSPSPSPTAIPWTIKDKIAQAKVLLSGVTLKVGTTDITYTEDRISPTSVSSKTLKEPEKEIALAALNTTTGDISIIKITKHGEDLILPDPSTSLGVNWQISIIPRLNGIRWNSWNTAYHVDSPEGYAIIANLYPNETNKIVAAKVKSKKVYTVQQTINYVFYAPYSPDLHTAELINEGQKYVNDTVAKALAELQASGTGSVAMPSSSVYDVWKDKGEFFTRIPMLEQSDLTEFMLDPAGTTERIYAIIGANGDQAFANTCNSSSACGWVQFTPGTYNQVVRSYPSAHLIKDFVTGAADHINSIKAAILLYDSNLKGLIKSNGQKVLQDSRLEEYLAASYNGSPNRATRSLTASILSSVVDWIDALTSKKGGLASETRGYLVKLRYLQEHSS